MCVCVCLVDVCMCRFGECVYVDVWWMCVKGKEYIDFGRLSAIHKNVSVPLVLHGGSGVPDDEIRKAIQLGVRIINLDTSLRLQYLAGLSKSLTSYDPKKKVNIRTHGSAARKAMEKEVVRLIRLLGSVRKA